MNFSENKFIKLVVIAAAVIILAVYLLNRFFFGGGDQKEAVTTGDVGPAFNDVICGVTVEQPACYNGSYPTPVFKWEYCNGDLAANQKSFRVRVSSQAYMNNVFPSVKIDTQKIDSSRASYSLDQAGLDFNKDYFWGVDVQDQAEKESGWWGWGSKSFRTAPVCGSAQ